MKYLTTRPDDQVEQYELRTTIDGIQVYATRHPDKVVGGLVYFGEHPVDTATRHVPEPLKFTVFLVEEPAANLLGLPLNPNLLNELVALNELEEWLAPYQPVALAA